MVKSEKIINSRIKSLLQQNDFAPKYLKNIIASVCHVESTVAITAYCQICRCGIPLKEQKKTRYGMRFASLYNKRHSRKGGWTEYFTQNICLSCLTKIESQLKIEFKKSYAP